MLEYKGYELRRGGAHMFTIHSIGKGALPKMLEGGYTNASFAHKAIDAYLEYKGVKDAKTNSGG